MLLPASLIELDARNDIKVISRAFVSATGARDNKVSAKLTPQISLNYERKEREATMLSRAIKNFHLNFCSPLDPPCVGGEFPCSTLTRKVLAPARWEKVTEADIMKREFTENYADGEGGERRNFPRLHARRLFNHARDREEERQKLSRR